MPDNTAIAATLRLIADQLDNKAGADIPSNAELNDPYADVQGPPPGIDPMEWAAEYPEAARLYALKLTHYMIGGHRADRDPEREARLAERDEEEASRWIAGNMELGDVGIDGIVYWRSMAEPYRQATGRDLRLDGVLGGQKAALDKAWAEGAAEKNVSLYPPADYTGPLRQLIAQMMGTA